MDGSLSIGCGQYRQANSDLQFMFFLNYDGLAGASGSSGCGQYRHVTSDLQFIFFLNYECPVDEERSPLSVGLKSMRTQICNSCFLEL